MTMRWEDERYVRLYTRNTPSWRRLGWQGRYVLMALLREVDRAGVLDLGEEDPQEQLETLAGALEMPVEVAAVGLGALRRRGTVELRGSKLVLPNFLEAQEVRQSDAARQRAHRERARDLARAGLLSPPEGPPALSQNVTDCHTLSHAVTPSLPSRAEPPDPDEPDKPQIPPPQTVDRATARGGDGDSVSPPHKSAPKPVQLTIADRVDPAPAPASAALGPSAEPEPVAGAPLTLRAFLEAVAATAGGRFQVSHKNRPRELRNGATEALTCGLPQHLWDRLRAELQEQRPTLDEARALGHLLATREPRGSRFVFWGQWLVVTPDNLAGRMHEALTAAAALAPPAPSDLPAVTAEPNTPDYYAQIAARSEALHGRR